MMNYSINTEYFRSHLLAVIGSAAGRELSEKNKSEYPFGLFQWPHDCWGYSEKKPGLYCVIPGPHGERPGMDRYSRSVVLVSVDGDMKRKDMEKICRKYDLSILYEYKNFSMYALQTNGDRRDREMNELTAALEKEKGILSAERDRMLRLIE